MAQNTWLWIGLVVALLVIGMLTQSKYDLFAVLPVGQIYNDPGCNFISNTNIIQANNNVETIEDFSSTYTRWISVDVNGDGTKEKFGYYGATSSSASKICDGANYAAISYLPTTTPGGIKLKYGQSTTGTYPYLYVCGLGTVVYYYRQDYNVVDAVTTCTACTPDNSCQATTCTTATCTNNCGTVLTGTKDCSTLTCTLGQTQCFLGQGKNNQYQTCQANGAWSGILTCSGTQTCVNGACTIAPTYNIADTNKDGKVDRTELGAAITKWISGTMTRPDLANAIQAWMVG